MKGGERGDNPHNGGLSPLPIGATRWGQRHPRLVAAGVGLITGSVVALISSAMPPHHDALAIFLWLEGTLVLVASIWAFVLFGRYTRRGGPWLAMLSGVACVMLAIATIAFFDSLSHCSLTCLWSGYFWKNVWQDILWATLASLVFFLIPQLMGAVGGAMIWVLTRDP